MIDRRSVLAAASASMALSALGLVPKAFAASGLKLGKPQPFSFDALGKEMQARAARPYTGESPLPQQVLDNIDYEAHGKITGEHIWRPLNNTGHPSTSAFVDESPKGFGLLQRDRVFDHYLDGVRYERRPSLWVEPLDDWGDGAVQLVEIPTDDEFHDNIVAMWVPKQPAKAGSNLQLRYRLHWSADEPQTWSYQYHEQA
jgi:glucan biosynthesis protein